MGIELGLKCFVSKYFAEMKYEISRDVLKKSFHLQVADYQGSILGTILSKRNEMNRDSPADI
jgi:hypothetical protein